MLTLWPLLVKARQSAPPVALEAPPESVKENTGNMSRTARIARNVVTNWLGFAISAAITLLLTPFVLEALGPARYGIWVLTTSIVGYYGLLDLGFRAGLTQHLTRYIAVEKYEVASEYLSSSLAAMCGLAVLISVSAVLGAVLAPSIFDIPVELLDEAFWCILIVGLGSAAQFALFPFAAIFPAAERFDIANYIGIFSRVVGALGILLALKLNYGLVGVSAATFLSNLLDYLLRWRLSALIVPQLQFSRHRIVVARLKDILSFGIWNFLISINAYAYHHAPTIIIAAMMKLPAVGQYALATGLLQQISSLLSPVGQVMYPTAAAMDAQKDSDGLRRLYHDGTRLMMLIMVCVVVTAAYLSEDFYRLWIGDKYLTGGEYHSVALLLQVLLISTFTSFTANIGAQIIIGSGRIRILAIALICGSLLSIIISIVLIPQYQLLGIAIAVVAASTIVDLLIIPVMVQRVLGLSIIDWICKACIRPILVCIITALMLGMLHHYYDIKTWWDFIISGILSVTLCSMVVLALGISAAERERFLFAPLRILLRTVERHA